MNEDIFDLRLIFWAVVGFSRINILIIRCGVDFIGDWTWFLPAFSFDLREILVRYMGKLLICLF